MDTDHNASITICERGEIGRLCYAYILTVEVAQRWIPGDAFAVTELTIKAELTKRLEAATQILADYQCKILPESFHIWLQLPEPWRASDFVSKMGEKGVAVLSCEPFAVGRFEAPQAIRICISGPVTFEEVAKGLELICDEYILFYVLCLILGWEGMISKAPCVFAEGKLAAK